MIYGYARVSTPEQHLDLQIDALKQAGCNKIITEMRSTGKERPLLCQLIEGLVSGDVLIVWKLDRLARSLKELIHLTGYFAEQGVSFIALQDNINTDTAQGRLFLGIMASLSEFERELIRERTLAGIAAARARGRKGGRPLGLRESDHKKALAAYQLHQHKELSIIDITKQLGIAKSTLYRYLNIIKIEKGLMMKSE